MYSFAIPNLLVFLAFLVLGGVSFMIWWKAKAPAALLMLVGFGVYWLFHTMVWFGILGYRSYELVIWMQALGISVATLGFVLTFWTRIQADVERFRGLARDKLAHAAKQGSGDQPGTTDQKSDES